MTPRNRDAVPTDAATELSRPRTGAGRRCPDRIDYREHAHRWGWRSDGVRGVRCRGGTALDALVHRKAGSVPGGGACGRSERLAGSFARLAACKPASERRRECSRPRARQTPMAQRDKRRWPGATNADGPARQAPMPPARQIERAARVLGHRSRPYTIPSPDSVSERRRDRSRPRVPVRSMRRPYILCLATLLSAAALSIASAQAPHAPEPPDPSAGLLPVARDRADRSARASARRAPTGASRAAPRRIAAEPRAAGGARHRRAREFADRRGEGAPASRRGSTATSISRSTSCCRRASNSGVYLMGRYEVQLFDSWGVRVADVRRHGRDLPALGRVARRRTARATRARRRALNASRAPGLWQHLEIVVPRAEVRGEAEDRQRAIPPRRPQRRHRAGERRGHRPDARRALRGRAPDRSADDPGRSRPRGGAQHPVQVVHRRRRSSPICAIARRSGEEIDSAWIDDAQPDARGHGRRRLSSAPAEATNKFAMAYDGALTVPTTGRYRFIAQHRLGGHRAAMQGPAVARARPQHRRQAGAREPRRGSRRAMADVDLTGGKARLRADASSRTASTATSATSSSGSKGPGVERQPLHDESLLTAVGNPINPIMLQAQTEPVLLRSFEWHRGQKRIYVLVGRRPGWACTTATTCRRARRSTSGAAPSSRRRRCGTAAARIRSRVRRAAWWISPARRPSPPARRERGVARLGDRREGVPPQRLTCSTRRDARPSSRRCTASPSRTRSVPTRTASPAPRPCTCARPRRRAPMACTSSSRRESTSRGRRTARMPWTTGAISSRLPSGAAQPVVRQQSGRDELLLPVRFDRGEATVAYSIVW